MKFTNTLTVGQIRQIYFYLLGAVHIQEKGGNVFRMRSPFRGESVASFEINLDNGLWYDFGLGQGGDVIGLVQNMCKCGFNDAKKKIVDIIRDPDTSYVVSQVHTSAISSLKCKRTISKNMPVFTKQQLDNGLANLIINRSFFDVLAPRGIDPRAFSIYYSKPLSSVRMNDGNMYLLFNYLNTIENCNRYKALRYEDGKKKMLTSGSVTMYPLWSLYKDDIVLCEGELDALTLLSHGIDAITSTGGAGTWRPEWNYAFQDKNVTIIYDHDEAGIKGGNHVKQALEPYAKSITMKYFPDDKPKGYDIGDFYKQHGGRELINFIQQ